MSEEIHTEAPVGQSTPAGGVDLARDAALAAQGGEIEAEPGQGEAEATETVETPPAPENTAGGDSVAPGEQASADAADAIAAKVDFKVISGVEYPQGTPHEVGTILQLTEEEAAGFAPGLIEKVEGGEGSV